MTSPILTLKDAHLSFGGKILFDGLDMNLYDGDRVCLVGKNGEGKSTLLKVVCGETELDSGNRWVMPGLHSSYLPQQFFGVEDCTVYDFLMRSFKSDEIDHKSYLVDMIAKPLDINKESNLRSLSGGQLRRVFLARSLMLEPELLLLDEPTNHLDIATIEWLEGYLTNYKGAVMCISHDRTFLEGISNKTMWLDRGKLRTLNKGYQHFDDWQIEVFEQQQRELEKLAKKLEQEEDWRHKGVTARRKRNQKRLGDLHKLRERFRREQTSMKSLDGKISYEQTENFKKSKLVAELEDVSYSIGDKEILKNITMAIAKGDKIGLIGPNGSGKTTLLNLITGQLRQTEGRLKLGKNITVSYYDQKRSDLDPEDTVWSTLCPSGDYIKVGDHLLHVVAYLKNFLFDPKIARDKVATLSGGQANRLMLARILANPGSLLILDEPTNDLDMDTLDMIQEILYEYKGTLLVVSHDRDFLDRVVTKSFIFDGKGNVNEYWGSYNEYIAEIKAKTPQKSPPKKKEVKEEIKQETPQKNKLTYSLQRELDMIPTIIDEIESEIAKIEITLTDPELFSKDRPKFDDLSNKLQNKRAELEFLWGRWEELSSMSE
jgi:ABC transport system ATP-binding/permease protein